ncbi:MAG: SCP2 sterol-binding domain-containing protein [Actinomycetota bacterium]|nr:SCP2 sterol-binding domain-containing protein [Actinomycetota bacterium]
MTKPLSFLSDAWLVELAEQAVGLPARDVRNGSVRYVITASPHGKVQFSIVIADGRVVEVVPGAGGDVDVTATWRYPDAVDQFTGALGPGVAYMTGRCKLEGDYAWYLYNAHSLFHSVVWTEVLAELADRSAA